MLRVVILAGLVTTTVSAFLLGAVFGVTLSAAGAAGAMQAGAAPQTSAETSAETSARTPFGAAGDAPPAGVAPAGAAAQAPGPGAAALASADARAATRPRPADAPAGGNADAGAPADPARHGASADPARHGAPADPARHDASSDPAPDPRATAALAALEPESYTLSAGAFARRADAQAFAEELGARAMPARLVGSVDPGGREWSEVTIGPYPSSGSAARAAEDIRRAFAITPVLRPTETPR
ncbi:SPOR domain-containing protein [Rubrimonas cliftonensis]|uniref:Meckel syndrome type 1 protein n=1 Tax=Rubrimonas cliftonensis TaxID=89524 RepID=A0A1H3WWA3_9RHOB|nr:SPOR domain-containing protein [Rubrimonas cliftonensis]SDZ90458.1 Meckel syndrome type 1 protein [Rubrimonas cliftonensis]